MATKKNLAKVKLSRSALGRVAFIGELFDARTEAFSSRSLFKSSRPSSWIEVRDIGQTEFDYKFTDTFSERSDLLKVECEIQVDLLLGLTSVSGSGCFLTEAVKSEKSVTCTLVCNMATVCEKFFAPFSETLNHIDLSALQQTECTHMISEVSWGAKCLLSLNAEYKSESDKQELKGKLSAQMSKLKVILSTEGKGDLEKNDLNRSGLEDIHIQVCADIVPEGNWPTSIESFCQFVKDVPKLLSKLNNGKGKQMNYVMIPLDDLRKVAKLHAAVETAVIAIEESLLLSTIYLFDEIALLKRKFHDLLKQMSEQEQYIGAEDLATCKQHQSSLVLKESDLKHLLSENWGLVKSGEKRLQELVKEIESFKRRHLNLFSYEEYLDSATASLKKLDVIKYCKSLGISYLGRGQTLDELLSQNLSCEFLVLVTSSKTKENDENVHRLTTNYFLEQAKSRHPNTKYVVVDFDYGEGHRFMNYDIQTTKCFHLNSSGVVSSDKYAEYVAERKISFVWGDKAQIEVYTHKPGNRVSLKMMCPDFSSGDCCNSPLVWHCYSCRSAVDYAFDDYFYCDCGRSKFNNFKYRCIHPNHKTFTAPRNTASVKKALDSIKAYEDMNILILGQSGVGKSTWVNAMINYLKYDTLEAAKERGPICIIPTNLVMYDAKSLKKHTVSLGTKDENEASVTGLSATKFARTYTFNWEERRVRIIDTPGLGDTSGIAQDKLNLKNIMHHISHLKKLHGVCILFKANENRMNAIFAYCLKELLCNLHKSVTKNIVFCFTNARNSFYTPGQSSVLLEKLIADLGAEKDLALGPNNMFYMDNEAFIFLCSLINPDISYNEVLVESFDKSWSISLEQTRRLFDTIKRFEPHELKETISLVTCRSRIVSLSKPIAEVSKTIQVNLAAIQRLKEELRATDETLEKLSKKLIIQEVYLEAVPLDYPRTVCTSPSCVDYIKLSSTDYQNVEYKTHCHTHCYIENVEVSTVNNAVLRKCDAMNDRGTCTVCGCGWERHMHIRYSQVRRERQITNKTVEKNIQQETSEKEKTEKLTQKLESLIKEYKQEQELIIQASVRFGVFLRRNAIATYNDSVARYLEYLIQEEEDKPHKSETEKKLLQSLKDMLKHYQAEVEVLQEVLKKAGNDEKDISVEEVLKLEQDLYALKLTGKSIQTNVECERLSSLKMKEYTETPVSFSEPQAAGTKSNFLSRVTKKALSTVRPYLPFTKTPSRSSKGDQTHACD